MARVDLPAIPLNPESGEPLYRQLYVSIKAGIQSGAIGDGVRLPATRELAGQLGVNRATVGLAYELLEKEGLLTAHVGRGTFVHAPPASDGVISFASSRPASELFPVEAVQRILQSTARDGERLRSLLQLGSPLGYQPLREYLASDGSGEVLITSGCQQALDLLARAYVQPGDLLMVEDPVYPGLREVFHRSGARLIGLPVGEIGLDVEALELVLRREHPRMLLVTPDFQNPTGATLPVEARQRILELVGRHGIPVVEIAIYRGLRYEGDDIPSLRDLDASGSVIHIGSFSKIAFPGLRVGWVNAPREVVERLAEAKQWCDLHTDHLSQYLLHEFARSGALEAHRRQALEAGRERLRAAVESLEACREVEHFTRPQGGMSLWATLRGGVEAERVLEMLAGRVTFLPGTAFAVSRRHVHSLRLSFAGLRPQAIRKGIGILSEGARQAPAAGERYGTPHMAIV